MNFIQNLKGYHNTKPELLQSGVIIGYGGKPFDLFNLTKEDFSVQNMARCLSREARYVGNTNEVYSVGQHVVTGAEAFLLMGRPDLAKIYMVHDSSEIILRDMTKPVKDHLKDYEVLQEKIDRLVAEFHGLEYPYPPEIKMVDKNSAQYEMTFMMHTSMHTDYWKPEYAEKRYIEAWDKISFILDNYYQ